MHLRRFAALWANVRTLKLICLRSGCRESAFRYASANSPRYSPAATGRRRSAELSPRRPVTRDHGIGLSLERPHPIQPVQIGMTDEQSGLQCIQTGAMDCHSSSDAKGSGGSTIAGTHDARFFSVPIEPNPSLTRLI